MLNSDKFHDECGVVAIFSHPEAEKLAYLGLHALQHRGQESAGIVTSDGLTSRVHKAMGLVADIFTEDVLAKIRGTLAIGHTRYSTAGDSALLNAQPILVQSNKGSIADSSQRQSGQRDADSGRSWSARDRSSRPTAIPK
jgi:amidophosphoribosyltransferase